MDEETRIIRAVQQGQTQEFAHLVRAYQGRIFHLAHRLTNGAAEAEDLVQEAFLKAFEAIGGFDHERRFFPWLFTIALNVVRNHLKKKVPQPVADPETLAALQQDHSQGGPVTGLIEHQDQQFLEAALTRLPPDQREAIIMRYYLDMTFEELAEALGVTVGAAKMRVKRGLENLRRLVDEADN
jgi:RNA polymerase sigma-70 factor (ECF subfamily)